MGREAKASLKHRAESTKPWRAGVSRKTRREVNDFTPRYCDFLRYLGLKRIKYRQTGNPRKVSYIPRY